MIKQLKIEKVETHYRVQLNISEYDYLEIVEESGRITIKFLDTRWRTPQETIKMLKEIIVLLESHNFNLPPSE